MTESKASAKPSGYRWVVFCLLAFGYLLVYFHRLCPAVVALEMQADLQTSGALLGFLAAAYFYPYALMQIPSGLLSDSWGPRKTITVFFALAGASSIFLGMVNSTGMAILARVLGHALCAHHESDDQLVQNRRVRYDDRHTHGCGRTGGVCRLQTPGLVK
jgi:sugar phosphate permease